MSLKSVMVNIWLFWLLSSNLFGNQEGATTKKILPTPKQHSISKPASNVVQKPQKRVSRTPIIIIPASVTSLVTLYNAKDLLQELKVSLSSTSTNIYQNCSVYSNKCKKSWRCEKR